MRVQKPILLFAFAGTLGCRDARQPGAGRAQSSLPTASGADALCPAPNGGLRLSLDSIAGLPANASLTKLKELCSGARPDSVTYAGMASPAMRFQFVGGIVWAVQNESNTDTLILNKPAEHWAAAGDSLRFSDGSPIPRRLDQLRALDSVGIMFVNSGDDTEGAEVSLCRHPGLSFFFDSLPPPADSSVRPFAQLARGDARRYIRVEQHRDSLVLSTEQRLCRRARGLRLDSL